MTSEISNLSDLPDYNIIRPPNTALTLPISKAFTSSPVPSLLGCWSLVRIPNLSNGSELVYVPESELLTSRVPGTDPNVPKLGNSLVPGDAESRKAVLDQLTRETFRSFSHLASYYLDPKLAAALKSHNPQTALLATIQAQQCQKARNAFDTFLKIQMDAAKREGHNPPISISMAPDKWEMTNQDGKDLYHALTGLPRTRATTSKRATYAMKGQKLKQVEGLGIYWRNEDGSLAWVAGDDSLVPKFEAQGSEPGSIASGSPSWAQTHNDEERLNSAAFSGGVDTSLADSHGPEMMAGAGLWGLTEKEIDDILKTIY